MARPQILVLGATGFTGRLVLQYLVTHPQRSSFELVVAGRSRQRLQYAVETLGLNGDVRIVEVDVMNYEEVEEAIQGVNVVLTTVGPYWKYGSNIVHACAKHGVHYVDITGEKPWVYDIIQRYDHLAMQSCSIIVPCCGFDSIPADLLVFLSTQTVKSQLGPDAGVGESTTAYEVRTKPSGGSFQTMITMFEEVPQGIMEVATADWSLSPVKGLPKPPAKLLYRLHHVSPPIWGSYWIMAPTNKAIVQRTCGLHWLTTFRGSRKETRTEAERLDYGRQFVYTELMVWPNRFMAVLASLFFLTSFLALVLFKQLHALSLLKKLLPQSGKGMSEEDMRKGRLVVTNVSSSTTSPPVRVKSVLRGNGDPGYELSAVMVAESALCLALDRDKLPALAGEGGILTPASALGNVLVRRMQASGRFEFETSLLEQTDLEPKKTK